jgi:hypothetical protein
MYILLHYQHQLLFPFSFVSNTGAKRKKRGFELISSPSESEVIVGDAGIRDDDEDRIGFKPQYNLNSIHALPVS